MNKIMLYIHIPFCQKKCNYCDFVSFFCKNDMIDLYIKQLLKEIEIKSYMARDIEVSSIYIGGGTPSFISSSYICFIIESINKYYNVNKNAEISIETNPNSISINKLNDYLSAGINRISVGLQSTNNQELKILGRVHTYNDFLNGYETIRKAGFNNINIDLINGIPSQTFMSYKNSLKQVLMLKPTHLSIYNLIIEENTVFGSLYNKGELQLPTEDEILEMDKITYELTDLYRYNRYEISNYSKIGYECKHNLGYWSDTQYIGFGLNAASYINNKRYKNKATLKNYLDLDYYKLIYDDENKYYDEIQNINTSEHKKEYIMLSLRKCEGININDYKKIFNEDFIKNNKTKIFELQNCGYLVIENSNIKLTNKGMNVSNAIISKFI